jgi:cellulose synthase/poly-beta-1,6-N-acetylglucosamine synthase-like glycosyltransferase
MLRTWNVYILTVLHFVALSGLSLYGVHRLWIVVCWFIERRKPASRALQVQSSNLVRPVVTVQLPIYNELFVAGRLIDAASRLEWSKGKLEIQILDDSTDDTQKIVDERMEHWLARGIDIRVIRRKNREGYKAGALKNGLLFAKGEYIVVFDADFVPPADFLLRTMPYFADKKIGMVQARWDFLNADHSWFSGIQSLLLGPHFSMEHWVRFRRGLFFNFNGTAGVWRREAIVSSGGWQSDTITEDLDLSYRAQLAGWKFVYLEDVVVPSELPVTLAAFRTQQKRWAKGSIQTARKILPRLLMSRLPLAVKIEAVAHLLANLGWLFGALVSLTVYPAILWRVGIGPYQLLRVDLPLILCTSFAILTYFFIYALHNKSVKRLAYIFLLPILSIGMAPSLALSVLSGTFGKGGNFERTPKFGVYAGGSFRKPAAVYRQSRAFYVVLNSLLLAYSLMPVVFAWQRETWLAIPFISLFPFAFCLVLVKELKGD